MRRLIVVAVLAAMTVPLRASEAPAWQTPWRAAMAAREAGDVEGWLAAARATQPLRPGHPVPILHEARALARLGRHAEAIGALERMLALGTWVDPAGMADFAPVVADPAWPAFAARVEAARAPTGKARRVLEIATTELVPEGIARDPRDGTLYLSTMTRRAILALKADGTTREVVASGRDGLLEPLGVEVDAERGELWTVSAISPDLGQREGAGSTAIHGWRLADGALVGRVVLPAVEGEPHQLNDLALAPDGAWLATDSVEGTVWRLARGASELVRLTEPGAASGANGIIVDAARGVAWVGCYNVGLCRVTLDGGAVRHLDPTPATSLIGIDGLELYEGNLLAIQNALGLNRAVRIILDAKGDAITRVDILDARDPVQLDPTTAVVVPGQGGPDRLVWIANARIEPWLVSKGAEIPAGPTILLGVDLE